nr:hypothetical protein BaRGS_035092 [Batillaria attramentaria]
METKTYTIGGPGGSNIDFMPSGGGGFGGDVNVGFGDTFGGRGIRFGVGGGDGGQGGGGGFRFKGFSSGDPSPRPKISGRPQRIQKKNPFAGLAEQKYDDIKSKCLAGGFLFEDPEMPAEDSSIFFSRAPPRRFEWRRPHHYDEIKSKCLDEGILFEDPEFDAVDDAVFFSAESQRPFEWLRPSPGQWMRRRCVEAGAIRLPATSPVIALSGCLQ